MLKPKELLYFYRLRNWENKICGLRVICYAIFGYMMAGQFDFLLILVNTLAIFGVMMCYYPLADYFDYKVEKERNFLASKIEKSELSVKELPFYILLPLLLIFPLVFINRLFSLNPVPIILLFLGFALLFIYSFPQTRLKERKITGIVVAPLGAALLFLQAYSLLGDLNLNILLLFILVLVYHYYLEMLHIIDDYFIKSKTGEVKIEKSLKLLEKIPLVSLIISLLFSFFNLIFLITVPFSLIRMRAVNKIKIENIHKMRSNIFSPLLSIYEFGIYGILGVLGLF